MQAPAPQRSATQAPAPQAAPGAAAPVADGAAVAARKAARTELRIAAMIGHSRTTMRSLRRRNIRLSANRSNPALNLRNRASSTALRRTDVPYLFALD